MCKYEMKRWRKENNNLFNLKAPTAFKMSLPKPANNDFIF